MKPVLFTIAFVSLFSIAKAQPNKYSDNRIYTAVEHEPVPPGGIAKFWGYLTKHIKAPTISAQQELKTKIIIEMVIEKDGSVSHIKVIQGISPETDKSLVEVLKQSPKWTPGMMGNKPVRVKYSIPITLDYQADDQ